MNNILSSRLLFGTCSFCRCFLRRHRASPHVTEPRETTATVSHKDARIDLSRFYGSSQTPCSIKLPNNRQMSDKIGGVMNVFDRNMKRKQKQWAASLEDPDKYEYLKNEVAWIFLADPLINLYSRSSRSRKQLVLFWLLNLICTCGMQSCWTHILTSVKVVLNNAHTYTHWHDNETWKTFLPSRSRLAAESQTGCMILQGKT